jgi:hypothetical protein
LSTHQRSEFAVGLSAFAGVMLIIVGISHFLAGLAGVLKHDTTVYAGTKNNSYILHLSTSGWGWIHMLMGIIIFLAGLGVFAGQVWARTVGVLLAAISAVANFAFIPVYPVWAIILIALDVSIIWALTAHGRDIAV